MKTTIKYFSETIFLENSFPKIIVRYNKHQFSFTNFNPILTENQLLEQFSKHLDYCILGSLSPDEFKEEEKDMPMFFYYSYVNLKKQFEKVFGTDVLFELKTLLIEKYGTN